MANGLCWLIYIQVPAFDMANHAPLATASATLMVHFKRRDASLYARHQHRQLSDVDDMLPGVGVEFSLAAVRDLRAGEEVTFSYNPDDDDHPMCNER